jgi:hypothetical protein
MSIRGDRSAIRQCIDRWGGSKGGLSASAGITVELIAKLFLYLRSLLLIVARIKPALIAFPSASQFGAAQGSDSNKDLESRRLSIKIAKSEKVAIVLQWLDFPFCGGRTWPV